MNVSQQVDSAVSRIAAAIGEPARARMLFCLMDQRARTSTELAVAAEVSPSTASAHLSRLKAERLVRVLVQGKHRYYSLESLEVAQLLESLCVLAGGKRHEFHPTTPSRLRAARTCYDHIAGSLGVALNDRFQALGWIGASESGGRESYELTAAGTAIIENLGINVEEIRAQRRRFAYPCLDWSERRPHLGGSIGTAILRTALNRRWLTQDLDSRALDVTKLGQRELLARFGVSHAIG